MRRSAIYSELVIDPEVTSGLMTEDLRQMKVSVSVLLPSAPEMPTNFLKRTSTSENWKGDLIQHRTQWGRTGGLGIRRSWVWVDAQDMGIYKSSLPASLLQTWEPETWQCRGPSRQAVAGWRRQSGTWLSQLTPSRSQTLIKKVGHSRAWSYKTIMA